MASENNLAWGYLDLLSLEVKETSQGRFPFLLPQRFVWPGLMHSLDDKLQGPSWGRQKRRRPLFGTFVTCVLSGLRWPQVA